MDYGHSRMDRKQLLSRQEWLTHDTNRFDPKSPEYRRARDELEAIEKKLERLP